jgi:hypothetical protein
MRNEGQREFLCAFLLFKLLNDREMQQPTRIYFLRFASTFDPKRGSQGREAKECV